MIQFHAVRKRFGERLAVNDVTLRVDRGQIYGLLGHNGAGKSTAIGMMLGQVWPSGGEVRVCGHDILENRHQALQRVGAIFETPVFYDYLSGYANLEILSHYTALTPARRLHEVIEWVGLKGRERSKVKTYSHGMRARLGLAQALLPNPELLILDEPGSGLDPEGIHEMRQTILRLRKEFGLTILFSSHLLSEVEQVCTHIAVLNQGRKVFEGPLSGIKQERQWCRLRTGDPKQALTLLREAGLIASNRADELIELTAGTSSADVVTRLVQQGVRVFEICHSEQTLEEFYLQLMHPALAQGPN